MTAAALAIAAALARPSASDAREAAPLPLPEAVMRLAAMRGLSVGGDLASCGREPRAPDLSLPPKAALSKLLAGSPCEAAPLGRRTFQIRARPSPLRPVPRTPEPAQAIVPASLAEVVVTADRRRTPLDQFAGTVAVAGHGDLSPTAAAGLASLAGEIPLLASTNLGPGRDKYFLRGVSDGVFTGTSPQTVSTYLDDLPLTYNAPDPDLRLTDVDRVEVLAGPQGALYGSGAIGGVLRIVSRAVDLERSGAELGGQLSATTHGGFGHVAEGWINAPVVRDRLGVRVSAYDEREDGWLDSDARGRSDVNTLTRAGGRGSLLWRPAQGWSVTLSAAGQSLRSGDAQYVVAGAPPLTRSAAVAEPYGNDFASVALHAEGPLLGANFALSLARISHQTDAVYDASAVASAFGGTRGSDDAFEETIRRGLTFADISLSSPDAARLSWRMGGFVAASAEHSVQSLAPPGASALYNEVRTDVVDEDAVYLELGARLLRKIQVRIGGRLARTALDTASEVTQPAVGDALRDFAGRHATLRFLPRLSVEWSVSSRLFVYFDATSGYRPAGFNTAGPIGQPFDAVGGVTRVVRADDARSFEVGARWTASASLKLTGSLYYTDWLGVRSDQYSALGLPFSINVGDAVIDGAVVTAEWTLGRGMRLRASGFAADPQLTQDRNQAFASRSDAGLPGVTGSGAAVAWGWSHDWATGSHLEAELHAHYVGPSRITFDAATPGRFGDYVSTGATLRWLFGPYAVRLEAANLADQAANTFAFGNPFLVGRQRQLTPLRPRTFTLGFSRAF